MRQFDGEFVDGQIDHLIAGNRLQLPWQQRKIICLCNGGI